MLHGFNDLLGFRIVGDDPIGVLTDLLFDSHSSKIRYLRAESEDWLPGGDLLIVPGAVEEVMPDSQQLRAPVPLDTLRTRPALDDPGRPGPSEEISLHGHFSWTPYWTSAASRLVPYWGAAGAGDDGDASAGQDDPLRSAWGVLGFSIVTADGESGAVEDLILDTEAWMFRYLVVSTGVWLPGAHVLISPEWLSGIDWEGRQVAVDLTQERIEASPAYDRETVLDRGIEEALHRSVGKPTYW